ncbi:unnamed protein product [Dibothriocephalus latus]|uniref:Thioredoxin domain-containing protein 17 n=1 Tax=Dibothriocephalus latus TaxID=60516 RepID=A0A3P7LDC8_DIBLA|nr:unnamed protein product [Dibothriocephalus latus]
MPATQIYVKNKGELKDSLQTAFGNGRKVVVLCEGTTNPVTGDSWNAECRKVEPLLEPLLASASENVYFFMIEVGDEDE